MRGRNFVCVKPNGTRITAKDELARIRTLAIPPAWTPVWICPSPDGHLQATGRDARGRKQYRYHKAWRTQRDETKYHRLAAFGEVLKQVRKQVDLAFRTTGLSREKIRAAAIRFLDLAGMRVGNTQYAETNGSFGLTTLRNRHAQIKGDTLELHFRGKSGQKQHLTIQDARLARIVRRCSELPGQQLMQYLDDDGRPQCIQSHDINQLLRQWSGGDFTAKDFRTWAGWVSFLRFVHESVEEDNVRTLVKRVAVVLGNTPTVCRKYYVHSTLIEDYENGQLSRWITDSATLLTKHRQRWLDPFESLLIKWLSRRSRIRS